MKKSMLVVVCLLMALLCACAWAEEYSPGFLMEPPEEVREHIAGKWPEYTLEDYCEVQGTHKGDFGFAMLLKGKERLLVGYHEEDGRMVYWIKNAGAVPQGSEEAWFSVSEKGKTYTDARTDEMRISDGLSFSVTQLDSAGECYEKSVSYRFDGSSFSLSSYKHSVNIACYIEDGYLEFWDWGWWRKDGTVRGTVQKDIRYVAYGTLPATLEEARESVTTAPELPVGTVLGTLGGAFTARSVKFTGGRNYPVYTGPGEHYARSGNGKGSVSTNDWIQVFGEQDGWILIQYDISADRYRIGWIEASALPKGTSVPQLHMLLENEPYNNVLRACALTDDPLNSQSELAWLPAGTKVTEVVFNFDGWSYVRVEVKGKEMCGFVPSDCIDHG